MSLTSGKMWSGQGERLTGSLLEKQSLNMRRELKASRRLSVWHVKLVGDHEANLDYHCFCAFGLHMVSHTFTLFSGKAKCIAFVRKHDSGKKKSDNALLKLFDMLWVLCFSTCSAATLKDLQDTMFPGALRRNTRRDSPSWGHFGIHEHDWWHRNGGSVWEILPAMG